MGVDPKKTAIQALNGPSDLLRQCHGAAQQPRQGGRSGTLGTLGTWVSVFVFVQGCGITRVYPTTSVIQGKNIPLFIRVVFGKPFLLYRRCGRFPQPCFIFPPTAESFGSQRLSQDRLRATRLPRGICEGRALKKHRMLLGRLPQLIFILFLLIFFGEGGVGLGSILQFKDLLAQSKSTFQQVVFVIASIFSQDSNRPTLLLQILWQVKGMRSFELRAN